MKNTHAVSDKWLDAAKYPVIKFTSTSIANTATGYDAKGTLDMHGVQKEITLPFTFENDVFKGGFQVNRMDYQINTAEPNHGGSIFKNFSFGEESKGGNSGGTGKHNRNGQGQNDHRVF